jgi:hypothetical protein
MDGKAIYFVGAGLPKALQQDGFPVPLMWDFVRVAAFYAASDDVLLTTLTQLEISGVFKHATAASIAIADSITPPKTSTSQQRSDFLRIVSSRPPENIEDLLIRAERMANDPKNANLPFAQPLTIELLPLRFSFAINRVFWRIGWNFDAKPLIAFLDQQLLRRDAATFVSFNYDVMLERGIEQVVPGRWSAATGYGKAFHEFVDDVEASKHINHLATIGAGGGVGTLKSHQTTQTAGGTIAVLKPHGSLNWLCQFNGNYHFVGHPTHLVLSADERVAYLSGSNVELLERPNGMPWPNSGVFISPPTQKTPLPTILMQEEAAIVDADDVVIIGWSAPPTDQDQVALIKRAIARRRRPFRRVTLIEWNPARSQVRRMRELFAPAAKFTLWVGGFQTYATRTPLTWLSSRLRWWTSRRAWS